LFEADGLVISGDVDLMRANVALHQYREGYRLKNRGEKRALSTEEVTFHNTYYREEHAPTSWLQKWILSLSPAMPSRLNEMLEALGQVSGKSICEIGCGDGEITKELASRGAFVSASDISSEAVKRARKNNAEFIPTQVDVQEMDACNLLYGEESFDFVVGAGVLHHIDIDKASMEISRVLKSGGKAVFVEPLAHNPVSNMWRRLTPSARTSNEWPLTYSEISEMGKHFSSVKCQEFALLTLLSSLVYLITHNHRAKKNSADILDKLDHVVLKVCKPLRRLSGAILIELSK
jgi:2-polyprenyl-3-methyl-5-hydroxy-6-metoxy-1,4-benzoquinol methylase